MTSNGRKAKGRPLDGMLDIRDGRRNVQGYAYSNGGHELPVEVGQALARYALRNLALPGAIWFLRKGGDRGWAKRSLREVAAILGLHHETVGIHYRAAEHIMREVASRE